MSAAELSVDRTVARRFDEAQQRFKASLPPDDYRLVAILAALPTVEGLRILDLGCGKGRFARALQARGAEVVGLDVSIGMLKSAANLPTIRGSIHQLPFSDALFDVVLLVETLQHVDRVNVAIAEATRVLRPSGRLIIIDKHLLALNARRPWLPNTLVKWIDETRGRGMYRSGDCATECWFSIGSLNHLLRNNGFERVASVGLLAPDERGRRLFEKCSWARAMRLWRGVKPGSVCS